MPAHAVRCVLGQILLALRLVQLANQSMRFLPLTDDFAPFVDTDDFGAYVGPHVSLLGRDLAFKRKMRGLRSR